MKTTTNQNITGALVLIAAPFLIASALLYVAGFALVAQKSAKEIGGVVSVVPLLIQKPQCLPRQLWNEFNNVSAGGKYATYIKHCRVS